MSSAHDDTSFETLFRAKPLLSVALYVMYRFLEDVFDRLVALLVKAYKKLLRKSNYLHVLIHFLSEIDNC